MAFISDADAVIFGAAQARVSVFLLIKMNTGPWLRLWSGVGKYAMAANNIDTEGGEYTGIGELLGMPAVSQLINGLAERVEFTLTGVDPRTMALVDEDADTVRSAPVHLALIAFDDDLQAATDPVWLWEGEADVPRISRQSTADESGVFSISRTVSLSVASAFTGRRRPNHAYVTQADQRARSPTDAGMDRTGIYNQGTTRKWP